MVFALSNRNEGLLTVPPSASDHRGAASVGTIAQQLDVEAEALQFPNQYVKRLRQARLGRRLSLDESFVDLGAAVYVVGLDRQKLLEDVRRAVGLQRPDLHLSEALAAELGLASERLL